MVQSLGAYEQSCVSMHYSVNNTLPYAAKKTKKQRFRFQACTQEHLLPPSLSLRSPVSSRATFLHQEEREKTSRRSDRIYPLNTAGGRKRVCVHVCQLRSSRKEREKKKRKRNERDERQPPDFTPRSAGVNTPGETDRRMTWRKKKKTGFVPCEVILAPDPNP